MVSGRVDATNYNNLILCGDGSASQIHPTGTGYDTIRAGFNNVRLELHHLNVYVQDGQTGIDWEAHHGGIYYCHISPINAAGAHDIVGIKLNQTTPVTGSWITDIQNTRMDFDQAHTALNCVGFDMTGSANKINITNNTLAGFNGTGIRIRQYSESRYPQNVVITGNDIETMLNTDVVNVGVDVQGIAYNVIVKYNYFEGIRGEGSRFVRVGTVGPVRGFTFAENYCLTENPVPTGFVGVEMDNVISPNIYANYGGPAGANGYSITSNTVMGLSNELDTPIRYAYDLLADGQSSAQVSADTNFVDATHAREFMPVNNSLPPLATLEIVYEPTVGAGETISFVLNQASGHQVAASQIDDVPTGTDIRKVSKLFYAGYNDLGELQVKTDAAGGGEGWRLLSARLIVHTN